MPLPPTLHVPVGMRLIVDATGQAITTGCNCGGNTSPHNQRNVSNNRHLYSTPEDHAAKQEAAKTEGSSS